MITWHETRDVLMSPCFFTTSALGHLRICSPLREFSCNTLSCLCVSSICLYLLEQGLEFVLRSAHFLFIASRWFTMGRGSGMRNVAGCELYPAQLYIYSFHSLVKKRLTCSQEHNLVLFQLLDLHNLVLLRNSFLDFGSLLLSLGDSVTLVGRGRLLMKNNSPLHILKPTVPLPVTAKLDSWNKRVSLLSLCGQVIRICILSKMLNKPKSLGFFHLFLWSKQFMSPKRK